MAEELINPFVGGAFAERISAIQPREVALTLPSDFAPLYSPRVIKYWPGYLGVYANYCKELVDSGILNPAEVWINKLQVKGMIINPDRDKRPQGDSSKFLNPENKDKRPPPLWVLEQDGKTIMEVVPNAYPQGVPIEGVLEETPLLKREIVPTLSLVCILNPHKLPIYDSWEEVTQLWQLWHYSLGDISRLILNEGVYIDTLINQPSRYTSVIAFMNQGKAAGASQEQPHIQLVAYPPTYAQSEWEGYDPGQHGSCDRCRTVSEKIESESKRMLHQGREAIVYTPQTDIVDKGGTLRVTPIDHIPNWEMGMEFPDLLADVGRYVNNCTWRIAMGSKKQGEVAFNAFWKQGWREDGQTHASVEVDTGRAAGGFKEVVPQFTFFNDRGERKIVKPSLSYKSPEALADYYNNISDIDLFPWDKLVV